MNQDCFLFNNKNLSVKCYDQNFYSAKLIYCLLVNMALTANINGFLLKQYKIY